MGLLGNIGLGVVGNAVNSAINGHISRQNADHNAMLTRQNWIYQQSNAHQLEVQDLKKAGLNPVLSATNSQLAGMSAVSGSSPSDGGLGASITSALGTLEVEKMRKELREKELDIEAKKLQLEQEKNPHIISNLEADSANKISSAKVNEAQEKYVLSQTENEKAITLAKVANLNQQTANSIVLTASQCSNLKSGEVLNYANAGCAKEMVNKLYQEGRLTKAEAEKKESDLAVALLKNTATKEWLESWLGEVEYKAGLGLKSISPLID